MQIDKDFVDYKSLEHQLPAETLEPVFIVESTNTKDPGEKSQPFKSKYGTLNLCGAHLNNFKITKEDLKEYEFVQKQRAYLYDPIHIKGSN